ncbi:MAG: hypothetical protein H6936_04810 [Burkholderiales bacterium]|nr:hypothetical protein [Nitrosomonas sp.]MCP5274165.1 hypothetical protein [Burkholderiales bacterium]
MASSNNALWIGAIVIVAALTAVELMSNRDNVDTADLADDGTVAGSIEPVSPQFDAGQIATGTAETTATMDISSDDNETADAEPIESGFQFDTDSEFASNLIVDLDNPEAHVAAITQDLQNELEADATENIENIRPMDLSADEVQSMEIDHAAAAPVETAARSTEEIMVDDESALTETIDDSAPVLSETEKTHDHSAESSTIAQHLAAAEKAVQALRMTTPAGDNAYEHYQAVLAADPDNAEARAGIAKMVDMYIYFAEKAIADDQLNTARVYLQRAEYLQPDSPKLRNLRTELE